MPRRNKTFVISVLFKPGRSGNEWSAFLDMLRYDRATVDSWDEDRETGAIQVTLHKENAPHTIERWKSFGINVAELLPRAF